MTEPENNDAVPVVPDDSANLDAAAGVNGVDVAQHSAASEPFNPDGYLADGAIHRLDLSDTLGGSESVNYQPPVTPDPVIAFILGQLQPAEQVGFLRGTIIWLSARIGTNSAQLGDTEELDRFNVMFQTQLYLLRKRADADAAHALASADAMKLKADEDAISRGFESARQMQTELTALYGDLTERLKAWHASTEPGGDPTSAPDEDRMLYDAWRIVTGTALPKE